MALATDAAQHFRSLGGEPRKLPLSQALLTGGGEHVLVSVDTLNQDVHFGAHDDPGAIGHKSLAVNLSDLAAMGAKACWVSLALRLPEHTDAAWLSGFARGFDALAQRYGVALCALDVAQGPLSITVQALGTTPADTALRRDGARVGDRIFVSGSIGDAACALSRRLDGASEDDDASRWLARRLDRPEPRLELGCALRQLASSAIDISDGLCADLGHILQASGVAGTVHGARLPLSEPLRQRAPNERQALAWALSGGDDYELCFTVPSDRCAEVRARAGALGVELTEVGTIEAGSGLRISDAEGQPLDSTRLGYQHFNP